METNNLSLVFHTLYSLLIYKQWSYKIFSQLTMVYNKFQRFFMIAWVTFANYRDISPKVTPHFIIHWQFQQTRTCVQTSTHSIDCFFCKQINSLRSIWHLDRVWYHVLYKHTVFSSFARYKELEASVMGLIHTHLHPSHFELLDALRVFFNVRGIFLIPFYLHKMH